MILSLCFEGFAGADRAMRYLQEAVGASRHITLRDASCRSPETAFVVQHIGASKPSLVLFGGWCALYERIVEQLPKRRPPLGCWWTSSAAQMGLAGEETTLLTVMERVSHMFFLSRDLGAILGHPWLPVVVPVARFPARRPQAARPVPPRIGLFCARDERARKNVTGCVLALMRVKTPFHLHLNGLSESQLHRALLDRGGIAYTDHGWMAPDAYEAICSSLSLGLQVSLAESHGLVVTEHLLRGVPVLASAMVPALEALPVDLRRAMAAGAPDSPLRIARQIDALLRGDGLGNAWSGRARKAVLSANRRNVAQARQALSAWP